MSSSVRASPWLAPQAAGAGTLAGAILQMGSPVNRGLTDPQKHGHWPYWVLTPFIQAAGSMSCPVTGATPSDQNRWLAAFVASADTRMHGGWFYSCVRA